jgi:HEAT repeat protein
VTSERQLDLFATDAAASTASLSDASLIVAIPDAHNQAASALALEAGRRRLTASIPALEILCRRFKGFGRHTPVSAQLAAMQALAEIGGRDAVARLMTERAISGPGLPAAFAAAARLACRLPPEIVLEGLRHAEPSVRADSCRCAHGSPEVIAVLLELQADLHVTVARAAACGLGRLGHRAARPRLLEALARDPTVEAIEVIARIADDDIVVLLSRLASARPDLAKCVLDALEEIDTPRAVQIAASLRRKLGAT